MKKTFGTYFVAFITVLAMATFAFTLKESVAGAFALPTNSSLYVSALTTFTASSTSIIIQSPDRLIIPAISVDATVQKVGLTKTGAIGIPNNFTDAAWYKNGPRPGEVGNAVIDGHVDNAIALAGVFKHLKEVKVGDDIYVMDASSTPIHFVVSSVDAYSYTDFPTEEVFGKIDKHLLRLITCGGTWIQEHKTYDTRLVVTAMLQ